MPVILNPPEYENPDWAEPEVKYVHDWRAYVGDDLRAAWGSFTVFQKRVLAENAQGIADSEDWD